MNPQRPRDPYLGALLGLACGDALGAPVEFLSKAQIEPEDPVQAVGAGFLEWRTTAKDVGNTISTALGTARSIRRETPEEGFAIDWAEDGRSTPQAEQGKAAGASKISSPAATAGYVVDCLEAAVWAAMQADSLEETLQRLDKTGSGLRPLRHQIEAVRRWLKQSRGLEDSQ